MKISGTQGAQKPIILIPYDRISHLIWLCLREPTFYPTLRRKSRLRPVLMGLVVAFTQQAIESCCASISVRVQAHGILLNFLRATRVDKEKIAALPFGSKRAISKFSSALSAGRFRVAAAGCSHRPLSAKPEFSARSASIMVWDRFSCGTLSSSSRRATSARKVRTPSNS